MNPKIALGVLVALPASPVLTTCSMNATALGGQVKLARIAFAFPETQVSACRGADATDIHPINLATLAVR